MNRLKLFFKSFISLGGYLLSSIKKVNKDGWDKRILIIFGGGIGDVVKRSIICRFLKEFLSEYEIYYLLPYKLILPYSYQTFYFNYTKAKINPIYFYRLTQKLKQIGFSKIIVLLPFWENFLWIMSISLKPNVVYVSIETPPSNFEVILNKIISFIFRSEIKKKFKLIKVISIFDRDKNWLQETFPSDVYKNSYFISQVIKDLKPDVYINKIGLLSLKGLRTEIEVDNEKEKKFLEKIKQEYALIPEKYCVLGIGSSSEHKNWPIENFVKMAKYIKKNKKLEIVIVGGKESEKLVDIFGKLFEDKFVNLVGKTTLEELCFLIKNCRLVLSNDTSFVHIGIAFRKHTLCPILNTQLGVDSLYGYKEINRWIYVKDKINKNSLFKVTPQMVVNVLEEIYNNFQNSDFKLFYLDEL